MIDLLFPVHGPSLPSDHGFALYGALSRCCREVHDEKLTVGIASVSGEHAGNGVIHLEPRRSVLTVRVNAESIPLLLPISGKSLDVAGHKITLGVPSVHSLHPAPSLQARTVTIKHHAEPESFLDAAKRDLSALNITADVLLPLVESGPHAGKPRRRVVRIKDSLIVGFSVLVEGLTAEDSVRLQEIGLGGRRKMGCGFFMPVRPRMR